MKCIGGNTKADIEVFSTVSNDIGEQIQEWSKVASLIGWLDYSSGDSRYSSYDAKMQESTHIFLADYRPLPSSVTSETARMIIDGKRYVIQVIDDPMNLHQHYEIYLKYTGGQ